MDESKVKMLISTGLWMTGIICTSYLLIYMEKKKKSPLLAPTKHKAKVSRVKLGEIFILHLLRNHIFTYTGASRLLAVKFPCAAPTPKQGVHKGPSAAGKVCCLPQGVTSPNSPASFLTLNRKRLN